MKTRKTILALFVLVVVCFAAAYGCGGSPKKASPVGFNDEERTVKYASVVTIYETVRDDKGGYYIADGTVKTTDGTTVELYAGKLLVTDLGGYTVTQTVTVNNKTYTRVLTLNVANDYAPVVEVGEFDKYLYFGRSYEFPSVIGNDVIDGEITEFDYKVYAITENGEEEQPIGKNVYIPSLSGKQYFKISATNSSGKVGYGIKEFTVREERKNGEYEGFSEEGSIEFLTTHTAIVEKKEYLEEFEGRKGVAAVTVRADNLDRTVMRLRPYSLNKDDYAGYDYLAVTMYISGSTIKNVKLYKDLDSDFKFEGDNAIVYNEWHTYLFPAEKVFENWDAITSEEKTGNMAILMLCAGELHENAEDPTEVTGGGGTVYIDSVYFANKTDVKVDAKISGNTVTVDITSTDIDNAVFDYEVTFNGNRLEKNGKTFTAEDSGFYYVTPISASGDIVYVGAAIPVAVSFDYQVVKDNIGTDKDWDLSK